MEKTVAFCTLGCKVNQYETDVMREMFADEGYAVRQFSEPASVYVINTCTVTNMADRKSRQMLHRARKNNPDSIIVAVGCYVQAAGEQLAADAAVDIIIGNNMKHQVVRAVEQYMAERDDAVKRCEAYIPDIAHEQHYEAMHLTTVSEHTRAYIKIQDGCNQFCSYCIIPYARGRVRSRAPEDILSEVRDLMAAGYKEIVLTGIHISSYGLDAGVSSESGDPQDAGSSSEPGELPDAGSSSESGDLPDAGASSAADGESLPEEDYDPFRSRALIDLIEALSQLEGLERIRLGSLEPRIITENFVRRLAAIRQLCPHFHLSLQSGCDATLKRMNRHYSTALYREKCELLRQYFDKPALTTDVIVGFPGETEAEFEETAAFLQEIHFADMHIFKYSKREGTRAARMPDQVDPQCQTKRSDRLLALAQRMHGDYLAACRDQVQEVLIEEMTEIDGIVYMTGHSRHYIRCAARGSDAAVNTVIRVRMIRPLNEDFVFCERID